MKISRFIISLTLCVLPFSANAQKEKKINPEDRNVDMDTPTFVPMVRVSKVLEDGDSIQYVSYKKIISAPNNCHFFDAEIIANQDQTNEIEKVTLSSSYG